MNVIVVDDEPYALRDIVSVVKNVLPKSHVHEFTKPADALLRMEEVPCEIAFLDIETGAINGLELAKKMRERDKNINIIFVTGYSEYSLEAFSVYASDYLLKPIEEKMVKKALDHLRTPILKENRKGIRIKTFGNFEVYVDDKAVVFSRSKSKELLAYLVHKTGTGCSVKEIASILYEDQPYSISIQKQVQTNISSLRKTLREIGVEDILVKSHNSIGVNVSMIADCDYYRFMKGDIAAINEYMGEYMSGYSWGEFKIGYLDNKVMH
ncbi:response regulator [Lachnospiraceae bacterium OttesenSCG-928-D06]|nr:response regulator [Lachnospiraceae bacterium OttesenSCG-928-D06]